MKGEKVVFSQTNPKRISAIVLRGSEEKKNRKEKGEKEHRRQPSQLANQPSGFGIMQTGTTG